MSKEIWLISDTHFNHKNMIEWRTGRPGFSSVEEMNQLMIDNWNSNIKQGDIVYHLGDVFMGSQDWFKSNWPRLNGRKRLIVGNHDDIKFLSCGGFFSKVLMWRKFQEFGILLSHVPLDKGSLYNWKSDEYLHNVHGHTHRNNHEDVDTYTNICVEQTNYKPINIEEVRKK